MASRLNGTVLVSLVSAHRRLLGLRIVACAVRNILTVCLWGVITFFVF